uniref:Uncharacterized protein n=1 Tax=Ciona intestinalis TaxID=7719 RepID=H2Y0P3_CIOIN
MIRLFSTFPPALVPGGGAIEQCIYVNRRALEYVRHRVFA